jgi:hypothetical protein
MLLQNDFIRLLTESGFHQITVYRGYRFDPDNPEPAIGGSAIVQRVSQARQTADSAAMMQVGSGYEAQTMLCQSTSGTVDGVVLIQVIQ